MKYHIGMDYKNEHADIFSVQGLNKNGESIADYSFYNGEEKALFADFITEKMQKTFIHNAREFYKGYRTCK